MISKYKTVFFQFILGCAVLIIVGCDVGTQQQAAQDARNTAVERSQVANELTQRLEAKSVEIVSKEDQIKMLQLASETQKEALEGANQRYAEAKKELDAANEQVQILTAQNQQSEQKIAAARKVLADNSSIDQNATGRIASALDGAPGEMVAQQEAAESTLTSADKKLSARCFSWNVESEGSDPNVIAKQIPEFGSYDIYALTEVLPESLEAFKSAVGKNFDSIQTKTGWNDRMQIIFNTDRFELVRRLELDEMNFEKRYRSPLVAHLRDVDSGTEFMVMVNHLARGKSEVRTKQAQQLVEWARDQRLPVIALGDYNFDYVFETKSGNDGFQAMMQDNIWMWIEPEEMIDTNWYDNPHEPDGVDDYPGSMLDFAFVAGSAKEWDIKCRVIVRDNDFPDDETTSDHRPFELEINVKK